MDPLPWWKIALPFLLVGGLAAYCAVRANVRARLMLLGAAVLAGYGMLQDQVSARLCPEYFTVLHNPIPGVSDPTLLGLLWGFLAGVPGGLLLGYTAGLAATLGPRPPWGVRRLVGPMLTLAAGVGFLTAVTGVSVARHIDLFGVRFDSLPGIPPENQRGAFVVACYHLAAYAGWVAGSVGLCVWVGVSRGRSLDGRAGPV
jgi:hypothetical protein